MGSVADVPECAGGVANGTGAAASTAGQCHIFWGSATAAYQVEGAVHEGGRGPSIWDTFAHTPGRTYNGDNADVADDFYHRYPEDIKLMQSLGIKHFRLSVSWPRIFPSGTGEPNQEGLAFYGRLLDALLAAGIEPHVTLYHWDLPQALMDKYGGWLSEAVVADFTLYARTLFEAFGDRVVYWTTFNEPWSFCFLGYGLALHAPGRSSDRSIAAEGDSGTEPYVASHNVLRAHAAAVAEFRRLVPGGRISMNLNGDWAEPYTQSDADKAAAERNMLFCIGLYADPLYFGDYPAEVRERVPHLQRFTPAESVALRASTDFYAMNHYASRYVMAAECTDERDPFRWEAAAQTDKDPSGRIIGPKADSAWLNVCPDGFRKTLKWISNRYGRPTIVVTESGCDVPNESQLDAATAVHDSFRVEYYRGYLAAAMQAKNIDGVRFEGYFAWSLLDNFEWAMGFKNRFGIIHVDFPTQRRRIKDSARWLQHYFKTPTFDGPAIIRGRAAQQIGSDSKKH